MNEHSRSFILLLMAAAVLEPVLAATSTFSQIYYSTPNCLGPGSGSQPSPTGMCLRGTTDFSFYCSLDGEYGYVMQFGDIDYVCDPNTIASMQQFSVGCNGGVVTQCSNSSLGPSPPVVFPPPGNNWVLQTDCSALGVDTCTSPAGPYNQSCTMTAWNSGMCQAEDDSSDQHSAFYCAGDNEWAGWLTAESKDGCVERNFTTGIMRHIACTGGMQFDCTSSSTPTMPTPPSAAMIVFDGQECTAATFGPAYLSMPGNCASINSEGFTQQLVCNTNGTVTVNIWDQAGSDCSSSQAQFSQTVDQGHCITGLPSVCNNPPCSAIFTCEFGNGWNELPASTDRIELA